MGRYQKNGEVGHYLRPSAGRKNTLNWYSTEPPDGYHHFVRARVRFHASTGKPIDVTANQTYITYSKYVLNNNDL